MLAASLLLIQMVAAAPKKGPFKQIEDVKGLPRVLLIGDSISIGYTLPVRSLLHGKANVHRPPVNCAATIHGLKSLEKWLATGGENKKWDIIHFNWGLHDLKYMGPNGENLADPKAETSKQQVAPRGLRKKFTRVGEASEKNWSALDLAKYNPSANGRARTGARAFSRV
jgi:acyl-CoA thioesterase-1